MRGLFILSTVFAAQVLASYINPAGSSSLHPAAAAAAAALDACSSDSMSQNSSALPAMLQELLSQSCLIPAMSSYLRNDSGRCLLFQAVGWGGGGWGGA